MTDSIWTLNPTGGVADGVESCCQPFALDHGHTRAACKPLDEPPTADPHGGWCGEGQLEAGPYPIGRLLRISQGGSATWLSGEKARPSAKGRGGHGAAFRRVTLMPVLSC